MNETYSEYRKKYNIKPLKLDNKEKYYIDLLNIEHSWSGRVDINAGNTFIMEAEQLLINSMELFEMGYFDCAYYSLRSAIDISTTMVFLSDLSDEEREKYLNDWKQINNFPFRNKMLKKLIKNGNVFVDMFEKMPIFFKQAKQLSEDLNKYVHKQGFRNFYISRNRIIKPERSSEGFIRKFEQYLKQCIGVVAVMRLAVDPFPILLMDEEILYRCFDSLTDPYTEDFVNEYIGSTILEEYKKTQLYLTTRQMFENNEKKNKTVFNVVKYKYIDTQNFEDIFKQIHLLSQYDVISVQIAYTCEKAVKIYLFNGMAVYFTDRNTVRKSMSTNGLDFINYSKAENKQNQKYDEAFISVFKIKNENCFVEHNDPLTDDEISSIQKYIDEKLNDYN